MALVMVFDVKEIGKVLNNKLAKTIWISCIDKPKSLYKLQKDWGIGTYFREHKIDGMKVWKKLEQLNIVDIGKGKRKSKIITSKLEWIPDFFEYIIKRSGDSVFWDLKPIIDINNKHHLTNALNSDAFKMCMNMDFLIEEVEMETKSKFQLLRYPFLPRKFVKRKESIKLDKKWKTKHSWLYFISSRIVMLSLFKSFREDSKCFEYFKLGHKHIPKMYITIPQHIVTKIYDKFKDSNLEVPEVIDTLFTLNDIAKYMAKSMLFIQKEWPDVWKEVLKELNLKEK